MKKTITTGFIFTIGLSLLLLSGCGDSTKSEESSSASSSVSSPAAESEASGNMITLETEIPPERIEGTPMPMELPGLEQAPRRAPSVQVPAGTTNLALGKKVTSSDTYPIIGDVDLITDGDKQAGEGYYVELLDGLQWVQIDLEQPAPIHAIWLWHFHSQKRAYHDVIVQISNDPEFKQGVTTVFNSDYDNSANMGRGQNNPYVESNFGKLISVQGIEGRYVRLYSSGNTSNDMNHYIEVEVFGTPQS